MLIQQMLSPYYVVGRLRLALWELQNPSVPWMSQGAVRFLEDFLRKTDVGIEFGSGRSTLWFRRHSLRLISIEHDPAWFGMVRKMIHDSGVTNIDYHHIPLDHPEDEPTRLVYDPLPKYVNVINPYPDGYFDFVLVDGHYREACLAAAIPKIKVGGILILDNSDWLTLEQWGIPDHFRVMHRSENVKSKTTIFLKTAKAGNL